MNFTGRLIEQRESRGNMEFKVGEIIKMKKKHPCGREVMVPRKLVEKNFRGYIHQDID